jgi:hypothetical protein
MVNVRFLLVNALRSHISLCPDPDFKIFLNEHDTMAVTHPWDVKALVQRPLGQPQESGGFINSKQCHVTSRKNRFKRRRATAQEQQSGLPGLGKASGSSGLPAARALVPASSSLSAPAQSLCGLGQNFIKEKKDARPKAAHSQAKAGFRTETDV